MRKILTVLLAAAALGGCQKVAAKLCDPEKLFMVAFCPKAGTQEVSCPQPHLAPHGDPGTYEGEHDRLTICIKTAAYDLARSGGPISDVAQAARGRCAPQETVMYTAMKKTGPVWPYQRDELNDELSHLATTSATQARAMGCGHKPGEESDPS